MKVKELKEQLANQPDDAEVVFEMYSGCCGDTEQMDLSDTDSYEPSPRYGGSFRFLLNPVDGYRSCRQAAKPRQDHKDYWDHFDSKKNEDGKKETP